MKKHWVGVAAVFVLALAARPAFATATFSTPSYSSPTDNGDFAFVSGAISENSCDSSCSQSFTVNLPKGYSASAAAIWLNMYYLNFADSAGGNINHAKLMLSKTSYNPTSGDFVFELAADLTANTAPMNTTFRFGVWFTIVVGDNTDVKAAQKLANNFTGAGANGECDSTAACDDSTTYNSVGSTIAPFRRMMLRGFDVSSLSASGLALTEIAFDVTSYHTTTNANAVGSTACSLTASTAEDLDCQVGLSTFAFSTAHLAEQSISDTQNGASGSGYQAASASSTSSTTATGFIYGLQRATLTPASSMTFKAMLMGFGNFYFYTTPGTGEIDGQVSWDLERPTTPSISYDASQQAFVGFLY